MKAELKKAAEYVRFEAIISGVQAAKIDSLLMDIERHDARIDSLIENGKKFVNGNEQMLQNFNRRIKFHLNEQENAEHTLKAFIMEIASDRPYLMDKINNFLN